MSAGTKVTVAIVVSFVVVLGIYYGFGGPNGLPTGSSEVMPPAEDDPTTACSNRPPRRSSRGRAGRIQLPVVRHRGCCVRCELYLQCS